MKKASVIGGHLGSNLGIVEATIALHYVFNSPIDKIVFDVSHQCYTHKILTGRNESFLIEEKYGEVNGYTNPKESEHDLFSIGHTATSISLACGLAKARDLQGEKYNVISIIGDGSLSGGEAFEGLDFAGSELNSNFIIIVNDNQMSIAENHGGLYKGLEELRNSDGKCPNNLFKALGYDYEYVKDGHDINSLITTFKKVKDISHPVVVHICTVKGKGIKYAEENKEKTHWVRPFDLETNKEKKPFIGERYDRIIRDYLIEKMKSDSNVVTLLAAVPDALNFTKEYRDIVGKQFIDVGIAEEHAVAMAAGLVKNGCKPVFATMSTFFQRTYDQISQEICINNLSAVLLVVNASVYAATDKTHIGIFDIPLISNIPNMVYLAPTNKEEYIAMLDWAIDQKDHPVAIRAPRNGVFYAKESVDTDFDVLNKYKVVKNGNKIAILALGDFFQLGEELDVCIERELGIKSTLINPRYISGLDEDLLGELPHEHDIIITLEDGILEGGWSNKISAFYGSNNVKVLNYGLKKEFLDRYNINEVLRRNRIAPDLIIQDIKKVL